MKNLKEALDARGKLVRNDNALIEAELASLKSVNQTANKYPPWYTHSSRWLLAEDVKASHHKEHTLG